MNKNLIDSIGKQIPPHENWAGLASPLLAGIGVFNLPLGLILLVGASARDAIVDRKSLSETAMPDEWLEQVAASTDVSQKGLAFLAKRLKAKGFVSIKDAMAWAKLEEAEAQAEEPMKKDEVVGAGAKALQQRVEREHPSLMSRLKVDASLKRARASGESAIGAVVAFTDRLKKAP